ncbi:MAG: hypothetical protein JSU01_22855 [Bacteroidetes bacterium]|nr:hypothetical protein [Bacteroidota bacterium]
MRFRSFYLYIAGAVIAVVFFVYEMIVFHASLSTTDIILSASPVVILSYLAFKVYHEDADDELM